jgi:hypothetical protein
VEPGDEHPLEMIVATWREAPDRQLLEILQRKAVVQKLHADVKSDVRN